MILLDEVEKAHPEVFNILLQILEDGRLTDAQGRSIDFRNPILIITSNIGAATISRSTPLGFSVTDETGMSYDDMKSRIMGELKRVFRPELLNRIDEVIVFHKLTKQEILEIVELLMRRVREQISTHEVVIELSDAAKELLVEKGYDPTMGARPLRRAIQRYIEDPLADFVLGSDLKPGVTIVVVKKDLVASARKDRPAALRYASYADTNSLWNTPPTFAIYMLRNTLAVLVENGGVPAARKEALEKASLVYGAIDEKAGAVGSLWDVVRDRRLNHRPEVIPGVLADECAAVLRDFFARRR